MMGIFDMAGTTISGWLSDHMPSRYLLFTYYLLRGISLLFLPYTLAHGHSELNWFAIFYGLDWVATVPPTLRLTSDCFGRENAGVIYGWIVAAHQLGAALAACGAGLIRTHAGNYQAAFWIAGTLCSFTGIAFLFTRRSLSHKRFPLEASLSPQLGKMESEAWLG
jgi:predicted MFS family arabinose efflux permease